MPAPVTIGLPYRFEPRDYQVPLVSHMFDTPSNARTFELGPKAFTGKRAAVVWPRRHGKDKTAWNILITASQLWRVGTYYYFLPTYRQAKRVMWDERGKDGLLFRDHIPEALKAQENESELRIELTNGSAIQLIGADTFEESGVGTNPIGVVFSEYALINPRAWKFVMPILRENGGFAMFVFTPRGENHAYKLFVNAQQHSDRWFSERLTVETARHKGKRILSDADIQEERDDGMTEELIQQEYYTSFHGSMEGTYFGEALDAAIAAERVSLFPYDPARLVHTAWDPGWNDTNSVWFFQMFPGGPRFVDYESAKNRSLKDWIKACRDKSYVYGTHLAPHDMEVHEYSTGQTRKEFASGLNWHFDVVPKVGRKEEGVDAARRLIATSAFDQRGCEDGLNALRSYHKEWDEVRMVFKDKPVHDWSSNGADAFQTAAMGINLVIDDEAVTTSRQTESDTDYSGYEDDE